MTTRDDTLNYDRLAADYARHRRLHPGVFGDLVGTGQVSAESRVLEVGCGTGNYIGELRARIGCRCDGVEPSAGMLDTAHGRFHDVTFTQASAESLPFADHSFDLLFSVDVIHHVIDRPAFFREARRVLKPGGRIATATDSADDIVRRIPLSSHFPETVAVELRRYPAIETLATEMRDAGFAAPWTQQVELAYDLTEATAYRNRAFSSLHLIDDEAFGRGLARLGTDLTNGPIRALSLYTLLWGEKTG